MSNGREIVLTLKLTAEEAEHLRDEVERQISRMDRFKQRVPEGFEEVTTALRVFEQIERQFPVCKGRRRAAR